MVIIMFHFHTVTTASIRQHVLRLSIFSMHVLVALTSISNINLFNNLILLNPLKLVKKKDVIRNGDADDDDDDDDINKKIKNRIR